MLRHSAARAQIELAPGKIHLLERQLLRLKRALGWSVRVLSGTVWITQDGDRNDTVIRTGESFRFCSAGLGLVSALSRSELIIEADPDQFFPAECT